MEDLVKQGTAKCPFPLAVDANSLLLPERIRQRMRTPMRFNCLRCVCDWSDVGDWYAQHTSWHWGAESRQYLSIMTGSTYYLIGISADPAWYYVCSDIKYMLSHGGWCPPTAFEESRIISEGHEVTLPVLLPMPEPYVPEAIKPKPFGNSIQVYCDGSPNRFIGDGWGCGIAAGWIAGDDDATGRVSLAGSFAGPEISELLGIIGALQYLWDTYTNPKVGAWQYEQVVLCIDSQNAQGHVFLPDAPTYESGKYLVPAITLAKRLVSRSMHAGIYVCARHVPSRFNLAHRIAKHEQEQRRNDSWSPSHDVWPEFMPEQWKQVFRDVAKNQAASMVVVDELGHEVLMTI